MTTDELILRQQQLLVRSAQLRSDFASQVQIVKRPLAVVDQARAGLQWLCRNPQWPVGALAVLVVLRPRRTLIWGGRIWWAWKAVQRARTAINNLPLPPYGP
jgi:hypothetical protein